MQFWSEILTKASWEKLISLNKEIDFILIGGWAAYLHTKIHKSKDIDIIVDYTTLNKLEQKYSLSKNTNLKKYEIKLEKFDIDIYVPYFSDLIIPVEDLKKETTVINGIKTLKVEALLILKQGAEINRRNTIKGHKDTIDILTLILKTEVYWKNYIKLLKKYKKENLRDELIFIIKNFNDKNIKYLKITFNEFKKWKKEVLKKLKKI